MASSPTNVLPLTQPAVRRSRGIGLLLAGLGMVPFLAGVGELVPPHDAADIQARRQQVGATMPVSPNPSNFPIGAGGRARPTKDAISGSAISASDREPDSDKSRPADALGTPRSKRCSPCGRGGGAAEPPRAVGDDAFTAALFGPPDRNPDSVALIDGVIRTRGDEGGYLDRAAAAGWTARWYKAVVGSPDDVRLYLVMSAGARRSARWYSTIASWDDATGYAEVEASRSTTNALGIAAERAPLGKSRPFEPSSASDPQIDLAMSDHAG
jgi:hypothetical protein